MAVIYKAKRSICAKCGCVISSACTGGANTKYCDDCRLLVKRESLAAYFQTPRGGAVLTKYRQSPKGKAVQAKTMHKYYQTPKGKAANTEKLRKYWQTPKGKAILARHTSKRRELSTNPEAYGARVELLHILQESCANCHASYKITHQVDHILALCLGGTDEWSNLQPLCISCHREKSAEDVYKLVKVRSEKEPQNEYLYPPGDTEGWSGRLRHLLKPSEPVLFQEILK